jgi:ABC-type microcin C transport system duplicated ATPase subunit YejF
MNDPDDEGDCLLVMASSIKQGRKIDEACRLAAGCHSFIQHATYIVYRIANRVSAMHIGNMVDKKYYVQKEDVTQRVYTNIRDGLYASEETPRRIANYARAVGI